MITAAALVRSAAAAGELQERRLRMKTQGERNSIGRRIEPGFFRQEILLLILRLQTSRNYRMKYRGTSSGGPSSASERRGVEAEKETRAWMEILS